MNIIDAAHKTVHNYPGGSESLAPRIDMSPAVLRNKVNPNNTTHHLTLMEASAILGVQDDHSILHALAATHGYVLQRVDAPTTGSVFAAVLRASAAKGELAGELAAAFSDGSLTSTEAREIEAAGAALQAAIVHLVAMARSSVPAAPGASSHA